ncbi:MAG: LysR family transcriptional regulator [Gordonibacter sp.]|uniref:LysR family transcriptional regulator n=1 Tax=Gordonibacter sp. TaxID=1968902 RepID=UPI002FC90853
MRLEQLEYYLEVAKTGCISIAANNLYVSQPALSRSVKSLEEELRVCLLTRTVDGVRLTAEGEVLLPYMQSVISSLGQVREQAKSLADEEPLKLTDTFRLYTIPSISDALFPAAFNLISKKYPDVELRVKSLGLDHFPHIDVPKDADIIVTPNISGMLDPFIEKSTLHMQEMFTGSSYLVVSSRHPLAGKKVVTRDKVIFQKLIVHENGLDVNALYDAIGYDHPPIDVLLQSNNSRLITRTLLEHEAALLTNSLLLPLDYVNQNDLCIIPIKNSRTPYIALYPENHTNIEFLQNLTSSMIMARSSSVASAPE